MASLSTRRPTAPPGYGNVAIDQNGAVDHRPSAVEQKPAALCPPDLMRERPQKAITRAALATKDLHRVVTSTLGFER